MRTVFRVSSFLCSLVALVVTTASAVSNASNSEEIGQALTQAFERSTQQAALIKLRGVSWSELRNHRYLMVERLDFKNNLGLGVAYWAYGVSEIYKILRESGAPVEDPIVQEYTKVLKDIALTGSWASGELSVYDVRRFAIKALKDGQAPQWEQFSLSIYLYASHPEIRSAAAENVQHMSWDEIQKHREYLTERLNEKQKKYSLASFYKFLKKAGAPAGDPLITSMEGMLLEQAKTGGWGSDTGWKSDAQLEAVEVLKDVNRSLWVKGVLQMTLLSSDFSIMVKGVKMLEGVQWDELKNHRAFLESLVSMGVPYGAPDLYIFLLDAGAPSSEKFMQSLRVILEGQKLTGGWASGGSWKSDVQENATKALNHRTVRCSLSTSSL